jgi:hypothetical protein
MITESEREQQKPGDLNGCGPSPIADLSSAIDYHVAVDAMRDRIFRQFGLPQSVINGDDPQPTAIVEGGK